MARKSLLNMIKAAQEEETDYAEKLLNDITYATQKYEQINKKEISKSFKPSSIKCIRCGVMQVLGVPQDETVETANLINICAAGTFIHEYTQSIIYRMNTIGLNWEFVDVGEYIKKKNLSLEIITPSDFENGIYETKLYSKEYNFRFLCDGIIKINNQYFILEIKSISNGGLFRLKGVPEKYKPQAISYVSLLGIKSVLFLFIDRDLFNKKTFLFTPTKNDKVQWQVDIKKALDCVKNNIIPAKPSNADRSFCEYCNYKNYCDSIGKEERRKL